MKNLVLIFIFATSSILVSGQVDSSKAQSESSKFQIEIEFKNRVSLTSITSPVGEWDPSIRDPIVDTLFAPSINFKYKRHAIFVSYDFLTYRGYFLAGYQYYPNMKNEKISIYFPIEFAYKAIETVNKSETLLYVFDYTYSKVVIGMGIKFNIWKGLYISSQSGIGRHHLKTEFVRNKNDIQQSTFNSSDGAINLYFQIGVGYSINL